MGVDVSAVNMIGVHFNTHDEGMEFIKKHFDTTSKYPDGEFDNDDINDITNGLDWEMISAYSDSGGVLGITMDELSFDPHGIGVQEAWKYAFKLMPKEHHERIGPHIWAQYW